MVALGAVLSLRPSLLAGERIAPRTLRGARASRGTRALCRGPRFAAGPGTMAHTQVHSRSAAREEVLRGATALADVARFTLGPEPRRALIQGGLA